MKHPSIILRQFHLMLAGLIIGSLAVASLNAGAAGAAEAGEGLKKEIGGKIKSKGSVTLTDFGDFLAQLDIPQASLTLFQGIVIKTPTFVPAPKGFQGFAVVGSTIFNGAEVKVRVDVVDLETASTGRGFSVALETPEGWKLSNMFSELKSDIFDKLSLPEGQFVLSSFDYEDQELGLKVKEGLNFVAGLDLSGPFALFDQFVKNKAQMPEAFVFDAGKLKFKGLIPPVIANSSFTAIIPLRIGVDFTKIQGMPKSVTDVVKKITTGDFTATVKPLPTPSITMGAGVEITLGTQTQPLMPMVEGTIEPTKFVADARLEEKLEMKWLALSNAAFQVEWDDALTEAAILLGIPFTGIGFRGTLFLGKEGDTRAAIDLAALARVQSGGRFDDFMFTGQAQNLRISDFIEYLIKLTKVQIPVSKIPSITFNKVGASVVPLDTTIAGKDYKAGMGLSADASVMGVSGGFSFAVNPTNKSIDGEGHLSPIKTPVFELTGIGTKGSYGVIGEKLTFDGAEMKMKIGGTEPEKSALTVHGTAKIPGINLSQKVDLHWNPKGIEGDFETRVADLFDVTMGLKLDVTKPEDFLVKFSFVKGKADFAKLIKQGIADAAGPLSMEIGRDRQRIARLKTKKHNCACALDPTMLFSDECKDETYDKHVAKCAKDTVKNIERELTKAKLELEKFSQTFLNAVGSLVDALNTVELKSASGEINGAELAQGKLPKVSMELYIKPLNKTITLKDLQFDFKNPKNSAKSIGVQIVNMFK